MPIILQALPLSLQTFWRYLLILPLLAVVAVVLLLAAFIPLLGLIVPGMVYAYCMMTGLRCALVARGHESDPGFGHMLRAGAIFALLTLVITLMIEQVAYFLPLGAFDLLGLPGGMVDDETQMQPFNAAFYGLFSLLLLLWISALAVPMTAIVASPRRRSGGLHLFTGIGRGIFGLTVISLVGLAGGMLFSVFNGLATLVLIVVDTIFAAALPDEPTLDWSLSLWSLLPGILWTTWASSWFFSAAVLHWEDTVQRREAAALNAAEASRLPVEDVRALRLARQQRQDDPQG